MKTLKYIILGVILSSLIFSSFSFSPSGKNTRQSEGVIFCETYTQQELVSRLSTEDSFFKWIQMEETDPGSSKIGTCTEVDFKLLWNYIQGEAFLSKVPEDLFIAAGVEMEDQMIPLYAIRKSTAKEAFPSKQDLAEVSIRKDGHEENYGLFLSFSESGTKKLASITRSSLGRDMAILFNGTVLSAPRVREEIKDGKCMISGKFTESEARQLKSILDN